jgi:hypothetical protein
MNFENRPWLRAVLGVAVLLIGVASLQAQPPAAPVTAILTTLTIKPDVDRAQVRKVLPEEVRATVKLYLDGKIQQWYARADGKGVVFLLNCATVPEARALMDGLPLAKANLASFEYTPLAPLTPLRVLLTEPQAPPAATSQP